VDGFLVADGGRLIFDGTLHRFTSDGVLVPSVSQVLRAGGLIDTQWYNDEHSARGTRVHALISNLITGGAGHTLAEPDDAGYLVALALFQRTHRPRPLLVEHPLHDPQRLAGLVDFYGTIDEQDLAVILDWKTGAYQWWHEAQTEGYAHLLRTIHRPVHRRATVHLHPTGTFDLKFHTSSAGRQDWNAALYLTERRLQHHGRDERFALCGGATPGGSGPSPDDP
jgi:hypothetical protein